MWKEGDEEVEGEMKKQSKEEDSKEREGHSKYSSKHTQHTLWVSQVSLSLATRVIHMKTVEIKMSTSQMINDTR